MNLELEFDLDVCNEKLFDLDTAHDIIEVVLQREQTISIKLNLIVEFKATIHVVWLELLF